MAASGAVEERVAALAAEARQAEAAGDVPRAIAKLRAAAHELLVAAQGAASQDLARAWTARAQEYLDRCCELQDASDDLARPNPDVGQVSYPAIPPASAQPHHQQHQHQYQQQYLHQPQQQQQQQPRHVAPPPPPQMATSVASAAPVPAGEFSRDVETPAEPALQDAKGFTAREIKSGAVLMGCVGGLFTGSIIGMPFIGAAAGAYTASTCSENHSKNGDRARRMGVFGAKVIRRAKCFNQKHRVTERASVKANELYHQLTEPLAAQEVEDAPDSTGAAAASQPNGATTTARVTPGGVPAKTSAY